MNFNWTDSEIDLLLDAVLPADSKQEYERAMVEFSRARDVAPITGIRDCDHVLRRRANQRAEYLGTSIVRKDRTGLPFTWVEKMLVRWARSPYKGQYSDSYVATLLSRDVQDVQIFIRREYDQKGGIPGFELETRKLNDACESS